MKRADIAREVAQHLLTAETSLDAAIRDYARLTAELIEARARMHVSPVVGADVVSHAAAVQTALAAARTESTALHKALAEVRDGLHLPVVDIGGGDKTDTTGPVWPGASAVVEPLRAVG